MSARTVVEVKNIKKTFRIPLESSNGVKQKLINHIKGRKGYREFSPLNDISFEIKEGEFFGIVGRNGSGKSTLLKTIADIYTPTSGSVHVDGRLIPFIELGVGFNPELTGRENIFLNGALLGFSHSEMEGMYDEIVSFAELRDFMEERLKNYSSGMQVRLAFSIAIRAQGDILLLDEVLAVGDEAFQQKCFDYFLQLKKEKKTVILVTHDMGAVERFCTRAMLLGKGSIELIGKPSDVANEYRQENIITDTKSEIDKKRQTSKLSISLKDNEASVDVKFDIVTKVPITDCYVGLTLLKNDANIGEINSSRERSNREMVYRIDKTTLNPGKYQISAALFKKSDKSLIAICTTRKAFLVKGYDDIRGSGMRLESAWRTSSAD